MSGCLNYTNGDYYLFIIYGEYNKVISRTCHIFTVRDHENTKPSRSTVIIIIQNFKQYGKVKVKIQKRKPAVDDGNVEAVVLGYSNS